MHLQYNIARLACKCACQFEIYNLCLRENIMDPMRCGGLVKSAQTQ